MTVMAFRYSWEIWRVSKGQTNLPVTGTIFSSCRGVNDNGGNTP
jgi:hypothetical protein